MTDDGELSPSPFDRPLARAVAGAVFLAAIAALVAIHWEYVVPPPENASLPLDDAVERSYLGLWEDARAADPTLGRDMLFSETE